MPHPGTKDFDLKNIDAKKFMMIILKEYKMVLLYT